MKKVLLAAALVASCGLAMAEQGGYVGALVGLGYIDTNCAGASQCDRSNTAFKVYGGSEFSPGFSVEAAYTNFGQSKSVAGAVTRKFDAYAFSVAVAYRAAFIPRLPQLQGVGRIGIASVNAKSNVTGSVEEAVVKAKPYFGLGLDFAVGKGLTLAGAIDGVSASTESESRTSYLFGVGAQYAF
jgi:OmpA-OmpF porin, OOP family